MDEGLKSLNVFSNRNVAMLSFFTEQEHGKPAKKKKEEML